MKNDHDQEGANFDTGGAFENNRKHDMDDLFHKLMGKNVVSNILYW